MQDKRFPNAQSASSEAADLSNIMNANGQSALNTSQASVLKNTYLLLGITIAFSALTAYLSMDLPRPGFIVTLVGFYGLFFLTAKLRNSPFGILSTFALTGFMGYTLGPLIGMFAGVLVKNPGKILLVLFVFTCHVCSRNSLIIFCLQPVFVV